MIQNLELTNQDKCYHNSPPEEILNPMQNLVVAILSSGLKYYPYRDSPLPDPPPHSTCIYPTACSKSNLNLSKAESNLHPPICSSTGFLKSQLIASPSLLKIRVIVSFFPSNPSPNCQLCHQKRHPESDFSLQLPTQSRLSPSFT